jgi:hypothetical protein
MFRAFKYLAPLPIFVLLLINGSVCRAEPVPQTGITEGVLTAKGESWIAVRADGQQESTKLVPRWIGGLPKNGGGLDKRMLALFRELIIGSRLKVAWLHDEHLRVVDIQVLQLPGQDAEEGTGNTTPKTEEAPAQKEGKFIGVVVEKGENWILIRPDGEHESKKFFPRWIGGAPSQGGGLDKDALRAIHETPVGAHVSVAWVWNERLRLTAMQPVQ